MEFGLLGPLLVRVDGEPVRVSAGKQRVVLATLLLRANQVVAVDDLAAATWDGGPPESGRVTLQNYVKRLRQTLGPHGHERIVTHPAGYLVKAADGELDLTKFGQLQAAGRAAARAGAWDSASAQLSVALGLWRGAPLADVPSQVLKLAEVPRLAEMRLDALEARIDADLHLGRHREVIAELQPLVAAEPLRERLHELLMLALYRSGRRAAALDAYRHAWRQLVDRVGIEPGPALRELNQRILWSDPSLLPVPPFRPAPHASPVRAAMPVQVPEPDGPGPDGPGPDGPGPDLADRGPAPPRPAMLPAAVPGFTGRARELEVLSAMLARPDPRGAPVVITSIGGTAGVGKTALAVHWARQAAAEFPGGQLYVNLRGFGPSADPLPAAEALRELLDALRVPAAQIPADLEARQALYRSLLADRRVLILLDNARDPAQVRPLLPTAPGALVVITSRNELTGLIAADGARPLTLDVLTDTEAHQLITGRIGAARVAAEPAAADELIRLCARLPLALAITAARAAARPAFPLAALAGELRDARSRLDALSTGEDATDVRAVLSWSYENLPAPAARMFRLLAIHPGPGITVPAAASLAGLTLSAARAQLRELTRCHLLAEPVPGRYAFHDLLRAYAGERARAQDAESERRAALGRTLDHYLHTAHTAAMLLNAHRGPIIPQPAQPGTMPEGLAGHPQALAWFTAEHHVLLAVIGESAAAGFDVHAWQLPWALVDYFNWQGHWHDLATTQHGALAAAQRLGDTAAEADVHRAMGQARFGLRSWDDARGHLSRALGLYRDLGDGAGQARTHIGLGHVLDRMGRHREALGHARQALSLFEEIGNASGQARALNNMGWYHARLGDYRRALVCSRRALALQREVGDRCGEAHTWDSLGYTHHHLGHYAKAARCYQQAIGLYVELGDRHGQAETLTHLGDMRHAAASPQAAIATWRQALDILDALHHPDADRVRDKLDRADELVSSVSARLARLDPHRPDGLPAVDENRPEPIHVLAGPVSRPGWPARLAGPPGRPGHGFCSDGRMLITRHAGRWTLEDRFGGCWQYLPVEVPGGASGLRAELSYDRSQATLDLGCMGSGGFRGWSGGARESFVITPAAATPGYLPGDLEPGTWLVVIGLHRLPPGGVEYRMTAEVSRRPGELAARPAPDPPPPADDRPPRRELPSSPGRRWLAGDLHTHTVHSDGAMTVPELTRFAAGQGLDFLAITDHNTISHHAELPAAAAAHGVTLLPGQEVTVEAGHAGALGDIGWIDFREPADAWLATAERAGGLLSVNHPLGGHVSWTIPMSRRPPLAEIWHWSWLDPHWTAPLAWWLAWDSGAIPVGGSDWHRPGSDAPPGSPTTWVECAAGETAAVLAGLREGRTAISASRDGPVLLRVDGELVAAGADGTILVGPDGPRARVSGPLARFPGDAGHHRLTDGAGATLALTA